MSRAASTADLASRAAGLTSLAFPVRLHAGKVAASTRLLFVTGDQRCIKCLGEGDEAGVAWAEVVSQRPDSLSQIPGGKADQGDVCEECTSVLGSFSTNLLAERQSTEGVMELHIDNVRHVRDDAREAFDEVGVEVFAV